MDVTRRKFFGIAGAVAAVPVAAAAVSAVEAAPVIASAAPAKVLQRQKYLSRLW